jgi:hypothetical protein
MAKNLASELLEAIEIDPHGVTRAVIYIEQPGLLKVDVEYLVIKENANFDGLKKRRKKIIVIELEDEENAPPP